MSERMLKVAPPPSEQERFERLERHYAEKMNARLQEMEARMKTEIAPAMRAEIVAEMKGDVQEAKAVAYEHGRSRGVNAMWPVVSGGLLVGIIAGVALAHFSTIPAFWVGNMAAREDKATVEMQRANDELARELNQ